MHPAISEIAGLQVGHARIDVRDAQMRDEASAEHIR
jgi:hypothetical protein